MIACPYCSQRPADSADHIFPEFLGGRRTVPACSRCNNHTFGSVVEARVSRDLLPLMVGLSRCGIEAPKHLVWKKAFADPSGNQLNLSSDGVLTHAKPRVERDEQGRVRSVVGDAKTAREQVREFRKKGREVRLTPLVTEVPAPDALIVNLHIGTEIRRLATKMCCALVALWHPTVEVLDSAARHFLLDDMPVDVPVRRSYVQYAPLAGHRRPLDHSIFVNGIPVTGRCYGVVELFGHLQLYVVMHTTYRGPAFGVLGALNAATKEERFTVIDVVDLEESPRFITPALEQAGLRAAAEALDRQVLAVVGTNKYRFALANSSG